MQRIDPAEGFDGLDRQPVRLHREQRQDRAAMPSTSTVQVRNNPMFAADMGAGQAELVAKKVTQQQARFDAFVHSSRRFTVTVMVCVVMGVLPGQSSCFMF